MADAVTVQQELEPTPPRDATGDTPHEFGNTHKRTTANTHANMPHRRYNPLSGEWVLVSPHRTARPWQGQTERVATIGRTSYDSSCYLCPGNERASGGQTPRYTHTFVFDNDFPALHMTPSSVNADADHANASDDKKPADSPLLVSRAEQGICRVICFSPRHDQSLPDMEIPAIRRVVDVWADEYMTLGRRDDIGHVQIFENKGEMMGCSNPHPHGQIWAQESVPVLAAREGENFVEHFARTGRTLLDDYLRVEIERNERIVCENDHFVALVPFWAVWPFETMIVSRRPVPHLDALHDDERTSFAEIVKRMTTRYDNLFSTSFPYSAGIHQAPTDGLAHPEWHLHMHFAPPLLRSATVRKFLVGYELFGEPQRDITPEAAAEQLRARSERHYTLSRSV
jgi:UDPglucose--hexose-1-phosphate uridylyltransferase